MRLTKTTLIVMIFAGLGGILYGFDIGIISGALGFMQHDLSFGEHGKSFIVAAVLYGGAVATLFSGPFADRFGRRFSIILSAIIFIIGNIVLVVAGSFSMLVAGRLIQGIGVGIITIVVPLYLAESIPSRLRGRGVALFQLCLTFGILLGYLVNYALKSTQSWQLMFAVAFIPSVIYLIGWLFFLPRSPRWLFQHGYQEEARDVLSGILSEASVDEEVAEIKEVIEEEQKESRGSWGLLLKRGFRKAFFIALAVGILNQLTGINVLLQYNADILQSSGLMHTAILGSVVVGLVNFVVTIPGLMLVDKVGRRPLLIFGTSGILLALLFMGSVHLVMPASTFAGYATLIGFVVFIVCYAVGPGVVVWLAVSEILPMAIRAKGMAIALCANSLMSAVLATLFSIIVGGIGYSGLFFVLGFFVLLYLLTAIFPLPETKDRSLEEIERELFADTELKKRQVDNRVNRSV
jgi:sugar porter (SP) family MFS transporter